QPRQPPRTRDCVLRGGTCDHEACSGEDTVLMRRLDGLVDLACEAEIVGSDDELFHANRTDSRSERDEFWFARPLNQSPFVPAEAGTQRRELGQRTGSPLPRGRTELKGSSFSAPAPRAGAGTGRTPRPRAAAASSSPGS